VNIGLALWPDRELPALAELARVAEGSGFAELWWPDHYDARECSAVLALCAMQTTEIRLGTAVTSPMIRHPALLASLFATLSELSNGRAIAGIGPGGFEVRTELLAMPASPVAATREAVGIVRNLLSGERFSLADGKVFPVANAGLSFRSEHPVPVYLAARGPRMLGLAGEIADGAITHGLAKPYLDLVAERVGAGARVAGRSRTDCVVSVMVEVAIGSPEVAMDALRPRCRLMVGGSYDESLIPLYGLDPGSVGPLRRAVRARDPDAVKLIDDDMIRAFALGGPQGTIVEGLSGLAALGVDAVILSAWRGIDAASIGELGRIAAQVAP
jgi:5,10-methylenetetrahydromethanopterin reductase